MPRINPDRDRAPHRAPDRGRTYTLTDQKGDPSSYFRQLGELADRSIAFSRDVRVLRDRLRRSSGLNRFPGPFRRGDAGAGKILDDLRDALTPYLEDVDRHRRSLPLADRFDRTLRTTRDQYLLYMLEIELTNRINNAAFNAAPWKMALFAHCLRGLGPGCRAGPGEVELRCACCEDRCPIHKGSIISDHRGVAPFISLSMDHRDLFRGLRNDHPRMAVLGIACLPELVAGMRLCESLGIPAVGVPLNANRCARWMGQNLETTFSLEELGRLIKNSV